MVLNFKKLSHFRVKILSTKRVYLFSIIAVIQILFFIIFFHKILKLLFKSDPPNCYLDKVWTDEKTLQEVSENEFLRKNPDPPKNIFFHETSCIDDGIIKLNARQACAIESAARINPDYNVFVLFVSQVGFRNTTTLPIVDALLSYPNVNLNFVNLTKYSQNTPIEKWMKTKMLYRSKYMVSHTSDVLRFLTLWKYSGTYLDLDVVMLKPLNTVDAVNYAGAEYDFSVAVGIIHLEGESGYEIADLCVKDLAKNFDGNGERAVNGPGLFTRVLHKVCRTEDVATMITGNVCKNFKVLPTEVCYNINWYDRKKFYMEQFVNETLTSISNSLMTHVWNHHSPKGPLKKDGDAPYVHIARKYCPKSLEACETF